MTKVNIIYAPQGNDATSPRYQCDLGELWMNATRKPDMHNVSMGFYSANYPDPAGEGDSIYVLEPYLVLERDYEQEFLNKFKYIFTWATKAFENTSVQNKVIRINHPSCYGVSKVNYYDWEKQAADWYHRKDKVVFIANNKRSDHYSELYSLRIKLADWIDTHMPQFKVEWYGQSTINRHYYMGSPRNKFDVLKDAKFSVCCENSYDPIYSWGYFTEKLPECWMSNCVPLYMGCYNVDNFGFDKNSYIDLRPHVTKSVVGTDIDFKGISDKLLSFSMANYADLVNGIHYNIEQADLFGIISEERVMYRMIEAFHKEEQNG